MSPTRALTLALLALAIPALVLSAPAQPPAPPAPGGPPAYVPTLTFDVASIREIQPGPDSPSWAIGLISPPHSSEFEAKAHPAKVLIQLAYGFGPFEISGGPDWINTSLYNVDAKSDHAVDDQLAKLTDDQAKLEKQHMLQALLADRFHLKVHWETKQASLYDLVLAKGGSKLQPTKVVSPDLSIPNSAPPETKGADIKNIMDAHGHLMTVARISPTGIAGLLSAMLRATVEDKTGLTGRYDFTLQYTYQSSDPDAYPPLPTAIQQQLGLELQRTHGTVDVLVIDHIDRPTAN